VFELVLAVRRSEFQPTKYLEKFGMEAGDTRLVRRPRFAGFAQLRLHFGGRSLHQLLDTRRVDPAIRHQLEEGNPGDLAAQWVERRQGNRL
jgi:hypothetical protein